MNRFPTTPPPPPLSEREEKLLVEMEAVIEKDLAAFKRVGMALCVIRDQKLYRIDYDTFEDYLRMEWDLERRRAYQLIDAHLVVENLCTIGSQINTEDLSDGLGLWPMGHTDDQPNGLCTIVHTDKMLPMGNTEDQSTGLSTIVDKGDLWPIGNTEGLSETGIIPLPTNERQARPLTELPPDLQFPAWLMAVKLAATRGTRITAAIVQQCVNELRVRQTVAVVGSSRARLYGEVELPMPVQQSFTVLLDEIERLAQSSWKPAERKSFAQILRELLAVVEG